MTSEAVELVQGTLEFLILKTLSRGDPMHGFHILRWVYETTDEALSIEEGSLYPALHRMERRKWIKADWATSEKGRRAKYYRLTAAGKKQLARQESHWNQYVDAVGKIVTSAEASG
jgi:transcriptional regulator